MDGLEHFPSESLFGMDWKFFHPTLYNSLQNTVFTYARQTGVFLPMNAMQFSHMQQLTKTFYADNYWQNWIFAAGTMKQWLQASVLVFDQLFSSNVNLTPST